MRDMQKTSIPWLQVIPSDWSECRIKDVGTARNGLTYKPDDLVDELHGTIVLRSSNIQNSKLSFNDNVFVGSFPEDLRLIKNDIIICSRNGSVSLVGKCALIEENINATFGAFMMRFRTTQHPKFSLYLLQTTIAAYKVFFGTTTVNQLTNSVFSNMLTALPPLAEQEAIAAYLDRECEKIGRRIELLERKADAYKRLRRSIINHAVTRGLNPHAPLKPSNSSLTATIPSHWDERRIKDIFTEISIKGFPNEPMLCATQSRGVIPQSMYENRVVAALSGLENMKLVKVGNFVISLRSFQGGIEYAYYQGIISAAYTILRLDGENSKEFFRYFFKSPTLIKLMKKCVTGIREGQNINYTVLKYENIPLPPNIEQQQIAAYLDEKCSKIDSIVEKICFQIERLKELKRSLINEVVTGKRAINTI